MSKYLIIGLVVLFVVVAVILAIWSLILKGRGRLLDSQEAIIKDLKESVDKERSKLDADRAALDERYAEIAPWIKEEVVTLESTYIVTDSDAMKYTSGRAIKNVARNRIAHNIAFDIIKKFPEPNFEEVGGKCRYSYKFKVKAEE